MMATKYKIGSIPELIDYVYFLSLYAPHKFPEWMNFDLKQAFDKLTEGLACCASEIAELPKVEELIKESQGAYSNGDQNKGAHLLQEAAEVLKRSVAR